MTPLTLFELVAVCRTAERAMRATAVAASKARRAAAVRPDLDPAEPVNWEARWNASYEAYRERRTAIEAALVAAGFDQQIAENVLDAALDRLDELVGRALDRERRAAAA